MRRKKSRIANWQSCSFLVDVSPVRRDSSTYPSLCFSQSRSAFLSICFILFGDFVKCSAGGFWCLACRRRSGGCLWGNRGGRRRRLRRFCRGYSLGRAGGVLGLRLGRNRRDRGGRLVGGGEALATFARLFGAALCRSVPRSRRSLVCR